jgi:hypothetical protein
MIQIILFFLESISLWTYKEKETKNMKGEHYAETVQ